MKLTIMVLGLMLSTMAFSSEKEVIEESTLENVYACRVSFDGRFKIYSYVGVGRTPKQAQFDALNQCKQAKKTTCNYVVGIECKEI